MIDCNLSNQQIDDIISLALAEDSAQGDITSETLIPPRLEGQASILAKTEGVLAGGGVAERVFALVDPSLKVRLLTPDGAEVRPGEAVAVISGVVLSILKGERLALNFLSHLSGIATLTARFIAETRGLGVKISDTRKTTPGLRLLEKYAVKTGGGQNHRFHLGEAVLVKDNHLTVLRAWGMSLRDIVLKAKEGAPRGLVVEVEVSTAEEALEAAGGGADVIMLDNIGPDEMRRIRGLVGDDIRLEASGGITLANVREVAGAGVDIISIGALTHSVAALDFSLEFETELAKT
ncbi:carboxylating nicotinate-nucleotide diphosphorylase [Chloroflexota bacterium]